MIPNNLGLLDDPRTAEVKKQDFKWEELYKTPTPFIWKEKPEAEWLKFPLFNQDGSSSCVAQAVSKCLGIENYIEEGKFVHFSARDVYTRRINPLTEGMYFMDGMNIGRKSGATIEQLMPSQGLTETQMNGYEDRTPLTEAVGLVGRGGNNFELPMDIDVIASKIEEGKPVVLGVRFGENEWFGKKVPEIIGTDQKWGHGICATPKNATLWNGKKAIIIEDSAYISPSEAVRVITEDWFTSGRIKFAGYYEFLSNTGLPETAKPYYNFTRDLSYGMVGDADVKKLQECLAYLKLFPVTQEWTGSFYGITMKAVKDFQIQNGITPVSGYVGTLTRTKLNSLFN
jgi:hypothetical protein